MQFWATFLKWKYWIQIFGQSIPFIHLFYTYKDQMVAEFFAQWSYWEVKIFLYNFLPANHLLKSQT